MFVPFILITFFKNNVGVEFYVPASLSGPEPYVVI